MFSLNFKCKPLHLTFLSYGYSPRTEGDLSFVKDERMVILDKRGGGWWKARSLSTNQEGFVPMNYVVDESSLKAQP